MGLIWSKLNLTFAVNGGICFFESQGEFSLIILGPMAKLARNVFPRKKSKPKISFSMVFIYHRKKPHISALGVNSEFCHLKCISENYRHRGQAACREQRWDRVLTGTCCCRRTAVPDMDRTQFAPAWDPPEPPKPTKMHQGAEAFRLSSEGCPDFSFLLSDAEVELSPTRCFVVLHLLVCFFKDWGCQGRAPVAPVCWEMEGLLPETCPGLLGKSFSRRWLEKSTLDIGSSAVSAELWRFTKTSLQLKLQ